MKIAIAIICVLILIVFFVGSHMIFFKMLGLAGIFAGYKLIKIGINWMCVLIGIIIFLAGFIVYAV